MERRSFQRHPLSADYGDITGPQWERIVTDAKEHGLRPRKVVLALDTTDDEYKVLDGWQYLRLAEAIGAEVEYEKLSTDKDLEAFVRIANDNRRHETMDAIMRRAATRRARVTAARQNGKSIGAIAEQEGVSKATVHNDLSRANDEENNQSVHPERFDASPLPDNTSELKPKNVDNSPPPVNEPAPNRKKKGSDRRSASGGRPPKKAKSPAEMSKQADTALGVVSRYVNELTRGRPKFQGVATAAHRKIQEVKNALVELEKCTAPA
jgi:hypothetical protein